MHQTYLVFNENYEELNEMPEKVRRVGRPPKKSPVELSTYKHIVSSPAEPDNIVEIVIAEPNKLLQYLKTLKSNGVSSLRFHISPERTVIKAAIDFKPTSHKSSAANSNKKSMYVFIEGADVYSYYSDRIIVMDISSMNSFDGMIEYIDQYSENITLFIKDGVSNNLNYKIYNSHLKMTIYSHIQCSIVNENCMVDNIINFDFDAVNVHFKQYVAEHFKKLLSKKSAKNSKSFRITAKDNIVRMKILTDGDISDTLEFNIDGNQNILNLQPASLYSIHFPMDDVLKFIININSKIDIYMTKENILLHHKECGLELYSLLKI